MSREQCVICIDNSEFMRNGDYAPTRMEAQIDSANLICGSKTESHPENTVALMTTAGSSPAVRLGLSTDFGKMMATLASIEIDGEMRFAASMRVARLVLKRFSGEGTPNRHIIAFVGSPIAESKEEMQKLGAELKKSNVAVDVVNFGEEQINTEKLEAFIEAVNKDDNSRLVTVPPGPHILSDLLLQSPIILGDQAAAAAAGGDGAAAPGARGAAGDFSDIAEVDPELAEVLRQSLEEYNQQQARERAEQEGQPAQPSEAATATQQQQEPVAEAADVEMDEDEELRMALEMSRQESLQQQTSSGTEPTAIIANAEASSMEESDDVAMEDLDEDEQLRLAMELSKQEASQSSSQQPSSQQQKDESNQDILQDEDYLDSVLDSLPGVNKEKQQQQEKKKEDE